MKVPCLWFDHQAEEAARFYTGIFKSSRILKTTRYGKAGYEVHKRPAGTVMTVEFELDGEQFTALNGGPLFKFNEAVSLQVGLSWQVVPGVLNEMMSDPDQAKSGRVMEAMLKMKKLDIAELERAYGGR